MTIGRSVFFFAIAAITLLFVAEADPSSLVAERQTSCISSLNVAEYCVIYVQEGAHSLRSIAISPNNDLIVASSPTENTSVISLNSGDVIEVIPTSMAYSVAFSSDGELLALGSDDEIILWSASERRVLQRLFGQEGSIFSLAFSSDDRHLASGGERTIALWSIPAGELLSMHDENDLRFLNGVHNLIFSPDNQYLASSSAEGIRIWRFSGDQASLIPRLRFQQTVDTMDFSPDGQWFAFGSAVLDSEIWRVEDWSFFKSISLTSDMGTTRRGTRALAFTADSQSLILAEYSNPNYKAGIRIIDILGDQNERSIEGEGHQINALSRSPDGQFVVGISTSMMGQNGADSIILWRLN